MYEVRVEVHSLFPYKEQIVFCTICENFLFSLSYFDIIIYPVMSIFIISSINLHKAL